MDKQEATKKLAEIVAEFNAALRAAESFACAHDLEFSISPAYGMGGWFDGVEGEWNSSSTSC